MTFSGHLTLVLTWHDLFGAFHLCFVCIHVSMYVSTSTCVLTLYDLFGGFWLKCLPNKLIWISSWIKQYLRYLDQFNSWLKHLPWNWLRIKSLLKRIPRHWFRLTHNSKCFPIFQFKWTHDWSKHILFWVDSWFDSEWYSWVIPWYLQTIPHLNSVDKYIFSYVVGCKKKSSMS